MNNQNHVAVRKLLAIAPDGREFVLTLAIGQPYQVTPDEWACPVCLKGLYEKLADQHGVDSWQSMQLAYQLIAQLLEHFVQTGGKLFWPEGRESISLGELFPHLGK